MKIDMFITGKQFPERIADVRSFNERSGYLIDQWRKKVIIVFIYQGNSEAAVVSEGFDKVNTRKSSSYD